MKYVSKNLFKTIMIATAMSLTACHLTDSLDVVNATEIPTRIDVSAPGLYPEGISYDPYTTDFLLSSLTQGTVSRVGIAGDIETFIEDPALISTLGIYVDQPRSRILVANGDLGVSVHSSTETIGATAGIGIYDLDTGASINYIDLAGLVPDVGHLANDLTVDTAGNIYVTDSFSPFIYRIDVQGESSIFATHPLFEAPAGGFGLNGIVYHPDGYLLVAHYANGTLFRISVADPTRIDLIVTSEQLSFLDGLALVDNNTLVAVSNDVSLVDNQIISLSSETNWFTADVTDVVETTDQEATTLVVHQQTPFAIYSPLSVLFGVTGSDPERTLDEFYISKIELH